MSRDWRRAAGRGRGPSRRALVVAGVAAAVVLASLVVPAAPLGTADGPTPGDGVEAATPTDAGGCDGSDAGADGVVGRSDGDGVATGDVAAAVRRAHAAGVTGEGVTVGVVDVTGFDTGHPVLSDRVRAARAFAPGDGVFNGGRNDHGTATAVTVARVAPDADLYLATFDRPAGFERAVEWLTGRGVDVVVAPVAAYGAPDDGTSSTARVAAEAARAGAVVVAPTGNLGRGHWEGPYRPVARGHHRFGDDAGTGRTWLKPPEADGFRTGGRLTAWLSVSVADEGEPSGEDAGVPPELELALYRANDTAARLVATSEPADGLGAGGERLTADLRPGQHYLVVRPTGGAGEPSLPDGEAVRVEVSSPTHDLSRRRSGGSIVAPAADPTGGVVAVGAVAPDGRVAAYSSRGPTADGRLGVDVVAPATLTAGATADRDVAGTSSAAAVAGGTAALVRSAAPSLSPLRVELLLRSSAADVAPSGPDVAAGHGRLAPWRAVQRARHLDRRRPANATAGDSNRARTQGHA